MKLIIVFFSLFLLISCSESINKENESTPKPVVAISPATKEHIEEIDEPTFSTEEITSLPRLETEKLDKEAQKRSDELQLKNGLKTLAKQSKLQSLEKARFQNNDLEIRILQHSGWWDARLFVLKRSNEKWSADFREITYFEGTDKVKKQTKTKIGEPKTGWENVWNKLMNEKILTLPGGFENGGSDPCPDCGFFIIETKTSNEHRFYLYTTPSSKSELYEARQVAKIADIIAEEFDLKNFQSL